MTLQYHPEAEAELIEAAQFYEHKLPGLGTAFLDEFDSAIAKIMDAPIRWRVVQRDIRRFSMKRFPYGIYYRIHGEIIRILVVKHHSRHPNYWKHRVLE